MKIFSYNNMKEAKKHIGYPCLFSNTTSALEQINTGDVVPGILRNVVDSEFPFIYYEASHTYKYIMPIDVDVLYKIYDLACSMNIKEILAAAIYLRYKEDCK